MAIAVGEVLNGTITGITNFGAFVDLGEQQTGLIHISEVSDEYVKDINDFLKVQDSVKVKVLSVDPKGKISLSIKQSAVNATVPEPIKNMSPSGVRNFEQRKPSFGNRGRGSFEDKISRFLKDSDEKLVDLKRNTESKRGGRGGRRS